MGTGAIEGPTSYCEGERVPWRHWPLGERSWSPASGLWGQAKPWEGLRPLASHTAAPRETAAAVPKLPALPRDRCWLNSHFLPASESASTRSPPRRPVQSQQRLFLASTRGHQPPPPGERPGPSAEVTCGRADPAPLQGHTAGKQGPGKLWLRSKRERRQPQEAGGTRGSGPPAGPELAACGVPAAAGGRAGPLY